MIKINGITEFLVRIIELLRFFNCYRNHTAKFVINGTILTCLDE